MTQNPSRSVAELRRESERTRRELSDTVDTLRHKITDTAEDIRQKVSPEHIKAEVSGYVADKGRHWFDVVKQQAMDNPMQALAAGTAIAVPAFKMIRSVPLPLLVIGAGLALSSSRVRNAVADKVSETLQVPNGDIEGAADAAREGWQSVRSGAEGAADQTRRALHDAQDAVSNKAAEVRDAAAQMADELKDRAAGYGHAAKDAISATASSATGAAKDALDATRAKAGTAAEAAKDAFDATKAKATETFNATRSSAEGMVRDNAALVGGIGLAIGALIAASLPSTRAESATMGGASDKLRGQAGEAAAEKFDEVKAAAMSAAESAAGKISDAALGADVSRATAKAAEKLKTVADEAITTAFEPSQSDHR